MTITIILCGIWFLSGIALGLLIARFIPQKVGLIITAQSIEPEGDDHAEAWKQGGN